MASRYQKFSKALANKLSNLELDIARLEQEIGQDTNTNSPEYMAELIKKAGTMLDEQADINCKIAECDAHLEGCKRRRQEFYAELEEARASESAVYSGELERIAFVYNDWVNGQLDRKCELECQLAELESNIAKTECQIGCAQETVAGFKMVKRDIRTTMLDNLLQHQRELKVSKKHYETYTADLANIEREIQEAESWIAGYDDKRLRINVEYYDWLDTITKLRAQDPALDIQHQQAIITLEADPRQHYKTRFIELDSQLYEYQRRLKRLRAHASKLSRSNFLERPILKLDQIRASGPEQANLLCDHNLAKQDIQELNNQLEILKCNKQVILAELEPLLAVLTHITATTASSESIANPGFWLPAEIDIFRVRIEERRVISAERHTASESSFIQALAQEETEIRTNLNQLRATLNMITETGQKPITDQQAVINEQVNAISLRLDKKELLARLRAEYAELDTQLKQSAG